MRSGRLRHLVEIWNPTTTADAMGGRTAAYTLAESVYAEVMPLSAKEYFANQQVQSTVTHRVRMRYTSNLTPKSRIVHDSRTFEVTYYRNVEERDEMVEAMCTEATG